MLSLIWKNICEYLIAVTRFAKSISFIQVQRRPSRHSASWIGAYIAGDTWHSLAGCNNPYRQMHLATLATWLTRFVRSYKSQMTQGNHFYREGSRYGFGRPITLVNVIECCQPFRLILESCAEAMPNDWSRELCSHIQHILSHSPLRYFQYLYHRDIWHTDLHTDTEWIP